MSNSVQGQLFNGLGAEAGLAAALKCFALGALALEGQMICNETIGVENHLIPIRRSFPAVLAPPPKGFYAFSFFLDRKTNARARLADISCKSIPRGYSLANLCPGVTSSHDRVFMHPLPATRLLIGCTGPPQRIST